MDENKTQLLIRRCGFREMPQALRLIRHVWCRVEDKSWFAVDEEYLDSLAHRKDVLLWGAYCADVLAAVLIVVCPHTEADRYLDAYLPGEIRRVAYMDIAAVNPNFRGRQLQRRLMRQAETELAGMGIQYLQCTVHPANVYSCRNVQALGYGELARTVLYGDCPRVVFGKALPSTHHDTVSV